VAAPIVQQHTHGTPYGVCLNNVKMRSGARGDGIGKRPPLSEPSLLSSVSPDGAAIEKDGVSGSEPLSDALYPGKEADKQSCTP
jgi:hypothetical protein